MRWFVASTLIAAVGLVQACGNGQDGDDELEFEFESIAEPGFIDQSITITNPGQRSVTATFTVTPLDGEGSPVPGVTATTAYGSGSGQMVLLPGENVDFVVLSGARIHHVEDVEVSHVSAEAMDFPHIESEVEVERWDQYDDTLTLKNRNRDAVTVAVSLLVYDVPPEGEPQQIVRVVPLLPRTTVEPKSDYETFDLTDQALRALERYTFSHPTSVKAYFTP